MQRFKTFIAEQSRAPLYHATHTDNVHDTLKAGKIDPSENGHVSVSRSEHYAKGWSKVHWKIDHDKLKHHSKIQPTDWYMGGSHKNSPARHDDNERDTSLRRHESEESVKGPIPLKHVTHLSLSSDHTREEKRKIGKHVAQYAPHIKIVSHKSN